jgi:hypothetical protein
MIFVRTCALLVSLSLVCSAEIIQGTVTNRTTGKPVAALQVVLLTTSGEQARTSTNNTGAFRITLKGRLAADSPGVVSAIYHGVQYFQSVVAGNDVALSIFDESNHVRDIVGYLTILQFQVNGDKLQVTELHALDNASNPPITRVSPDNFILSIPNGAQLQPAIVSGPERGTLALPLVPIDSKRERYRVDFPLKPGRSKYAITYQVPYNSKFMFRRAAQYAMQRVGVVMPASMHFQSLGPNSFHPVPGQPGRQDLVLDGLQAKQVFSFELSGKGKLAGAFSPSTSHLSGVIDVPGVDVPSEVQSLIKARWPGAESAKSVPPAQINASILPEWLWIALGAVIFSAVLFWALKQRRYVGL